MPFEAQSTIHKPQPTTDDQQPNQTHYSEWLLLLLLLLWCLESRIWNLEILKEKDVENMKNVKSIEYRKYGKSCDRKT